MGGNDYADEKPIHEVPVDGFWLARYPVTNAQYKLFIEAGGYDKQQWWTAEGWQVRQKEKWAEPRYWGDAKWNGGQQPVVGVSWYEAVAFCAWAADTTGGEKCGCRRRRNGKRARGEQTAVLSPGVRRTQIISCVTLVSMSGRQLQWVSTVRKAIVPMAARTWRAMCGIGRPIGTKPILETVSRMMIMARNTAWCGAARGAAIVTTCAAPTASGIPPTTGSSMSGFVARALLSEMLVSGILFSAFSAFLWGFGGFPQHLPAKRVAKNFAKQIDWFNLQD